MTQAPAILQPFAASAAPNADAQGPRPIRPVGISRRQLEHALAEGRRLQGQAIRAGFRAAFNLVFRRRRPGRPQFGGRHQPC